MRSLLLFLTCAASFFVLAISEQPLVSTYSGINASATKHTEPLHVQLIDSVQLSPKDRKQLRFRFNQRIHVPGEIPSASMLHAIRIVPELDCRWFFPAPDTLACDAALPQEALYRIDINTRFTALDQQLAAPAHYEFHAGAWHLELHLPEILHVAALESHLLLTVDNRWSDEQLAQLEWRSPGGMTTPVTMKLLGESRNEETAYTFYTLSLTAEASGVYQLVLPAGLTPYQQAERIVWQGHIYQQPTLLGWYCWQLDENARQNLAYHAIDPVNNHCPPSNLALRFIGEITPVEGRSGWYQPAPLRSQFISGPEAVAAEFPNPDGSRYLHLHLTGQSDYQFHLSEQLFEAEDIRMTTNAAIPLWQLASRSNDEPGPTLIHWPDEVWHQHYQKVNTFELDGEQLTRLSDEPLLIPRLHTQQSAKLNLLFQWQHFSKAAEFQQWMNALWQDQPLVSILSWQSARQLMPDLSTEQTKPELWHNTPWLNPKPDANFGQHSAFFSPEQIAQSGLYPYRIGDAQRQVQHWLQRPAFNLEVLQLGDVLIRLSDWQNQPKPDTKMYRVCPGQPSPFALGQTDQHGLLLLTAEALQAVPGVSTKTPCWLWAEAAEGMAAIPLPKAAVVQTLHAWLVTSQPAYQQGDDVELMTVLRQRSPQGLIAPTDVSQLAIELHSFSGSLLQRLPLQAANDTGWYHQTLPASWFPEAGYYRLSLRQGATQLESTTIQIARFELPLYRIDSTLTAMSAAGEHSQLELSMQSMSGQGLVSTIRIEGRWEPTSLHRQPWLPKGYNFSDQGRYPTPDSKSWSLQTDHNGSQVQEFGLPESITLSQGAPAYELRLNYETRAMMGEWQRHTQSTLLLNRDHLVGSKIENQHIKLRAFVLQDGKLTAAESIPVSAIEWREGPLTDSPLLAECAVAAMAQLPMTCPLPMSLRTSQRTAVYMHLRSGETEQLTIRRFTLAESPPPAPPKPLQASLTAPREIDHWAPLNIELHSPTATEAVLLLYTDRIHQLIPLSLEAGTTPIELPITPAMAPELRLALFSTNSAGTWSGSYHRIKSSLESFELPLSLELQKPHANASLATSSQQTLILTAAEDADIALFWLDESLLYLLASKHIERLHPNTLLNHAWIPRAQSYELAQLHKLQPYEITSWLSPWFAYQNAEHVAFNMPASSLSDSMQTDRRTSTPPASGLKPPPLWLGVHNMKAGQTQHLTITAPQQPGQWHLIAIAASTTKFTQQQHSFTVKDNWQTMLAVPDSHYPTDQAYASVLWFNASQAPLQGRFQLQLNGEALQQFSVALAPGERRQQAIALPTLPPGQQQLSLWQLDENNTEPPHLLQQQSWQITPDTVQQQVRLQADNSGMLKLPEAATQVTGSASSLALLQPDWSALIPTTKVAPASWEVLFSEWWLAERLSQSSPRWANEQPLHYWALPFQKAGKYSRYKTTNSNNSVTLFSYWLQSQLADPHALPDNSNRLLDEWRKQLNDGRLSPTNQALLAWWLSRQNALSLTELLSLRSKIGQQASISDTAATLAILLLALNEQQQAADNDMEQTIIAQQRHNWLNTLLALGYRDASYSALSSDSACWLLLAAGSDEARLQGLKQRLILTQQATGSFGSARSNAICTAALFSNLSPLAEPLQLELTAGRQAGLWHHKAAELNWLSLQYTQPLATYRAEYSGISISKSFLSYQDGEWHPATSFVAGDLVQVVLTLNTPIAREHVRVSDPLLPGMQPLPRRYQRSTGFQQASGAYFSAAQQQERAMHWHSSYLPAGETTLRYTVQIRLPGTYHHGVSRVEAMYNPLVFGSTDGSNQVTIQPPAAWY